MNTDINVLLEVLQKNKSNMSGLPPIENAAIYHSYRTYHQIQHWIGVKKCRRLGLDYDRKWFTANSHEGKTSA